MIYIFGDCELDAARCELWRAGATVTVGPQVFKVWFPRIRDSGNQQSLQRFHITLDDEDLLLLQLLLQSFFERRQELSRFLRVRRQHAVDDDGITIGDARYCPKAFIGLGKEGEAAKLIEKLLL